MLSSGLERSDKNKARLFRVSLGRILRSYLFWTYDRGSVPYDVMVTVILAFIFITPRFVNFNDKPIERTPPLAGVVARPDGESILYEVPAAAVDGTSDDRVRDSLLKAIEPYCRCELQLSRWSRVFDARGRVVTYKAWVARP